MIFSLFGARGPLKFSLLSGENQSTKVKHPWELSGPDEAHPTVLREPVFVVAKSLANIFQKCGSQVKTHVLEKGRHDAHCQK